MMKEYGWIPYEEFLDMYLPVMWNLIEEINIDRNEIRKQQEKNKCQQ
jgi:hypothetical protein